MWFFLFYSILFHFFRLIPENRLHSFPFPSLFRILLVILLRRLECLCPCLSHVCAWVGFMGCKCRILGNDGTGW